MSAFDEALPKAAAAVQAMPCYAALKSVTAVRDLKGRIRLLLDFPAKALDASLDDLPADWSVQKQALQARLAADLSAYWGGAIWRGRERKDPVFAAVAAEVLAHRQSWDAGAPAVPPVNWFKLERQFSKSSWGAVATQPWLITDATKPAIIAFYSFKGGGGRTVALSSVALLLAQAGHKVVVVDLDLEAPGAAPFLLGAAALPAEGVVDYLIEWQLQGTNPPTLAPFVSLQADPALVGSDPIRVLASGRVNPAFVEKVARLDFESYTNQGSNPLTELVRQIATEYQPAFILLDVRSGLHDLGGLSLNVLSHLNVLFNRDSEQAWAGLETVLAILGEHRHAGHSAELLVVHSFVPSADRDATAHERFLNRSYAAFEDSSYFAETETMPDIASPDAPYGLPIPFQESLQNVSGAALLKPNTDSDGTYVNLAKRLGSALGRHTL